MTTTRILRLTIGAVLISGALAVAPPAGATTRPTPAQHYLAIVKPFNAAGTTLGRAWGSDGSSTSDAVLSQQVQPYIKAVKTFNGQLLSYHWPKVARTDVRSLVAEDAALLAVLRSVTPRTHITFAAFTASVNHVAFPAVARVRHDLGLPPPSSSVPTIGDTITVLNQAKQYEAVKLVQVIDPAQPAVSGLGPNPGYRYVGVELQISNKSAGIDSGDANNNTSVIGSNEQGYTPDFDAIAGCTNFNDGEYALPQGQAEIGCVTFQIPTGVTVSKVEYNPNSGLSTNEAIWTVPTP